MTDASPDQPNGAANPYRVFDDLTDLVVVLDEGFTVAYTNTFTRTLLGYGPCDVEGRPITEFMTDEAVKPVISAAGKVAQWKAMLKVVSGRGLK